MDHISQHRCAPCEAPLWTHMPLHLILHPLQLAEGDLEVGHQTRMPSVGEEHTLLETHCTDLVLHLLLRCRMCLQHFLAAGTHTMTLPLTHLSACNHPDLET